MAVEAKVLIDAKAAEDSQTTQYTSTGGVTLIDTMTATNVSASPATISVNLVPSGGTAGDTNLIVDAKNLAAGETYTFPEVVRQALDDGDFISTIAGTASAITIRASGRFIT